MQLHAVADPVVIEPAAPEPGATTPGDPAAVITGLIADGQHRAAVAACARAYGDVLGRLCMALLGSQADADEAVQESLLRAHRAMASYRADGSVKAWLCGIARHVCAYLLERRRLGRQALALVALDPERGDSDAVARRQQARAVRGALDQLRPSERDALVLRYVAELSHREIAAAMQLDEAAARKRISRALAHLRAVMPEQEIA